MAVPKSDFDPHKLLVSMITSGYSTGRLFKIECTRSHLVGYAKLPTGSPPYPIAVQCHECSEIAAISVPLLAEEPAQRPVAQEPPKPSAPAIAPESIVDLDKLSDEELAERAKDAPMGSGLAKKILKIRNSRTLSRARKIKEDRFLGEMEAMSESISKHWDEFCQNRPTDIMQALQVLIKANPYEPKVMMNPSILFVACWYAWEIWQKKFVSRLASEWNFPNDACLRGRVSSAWEWVGDDVKLKMPFMVEATAAPRQAEEALKKLGEKKAEPKPVFTVVASNEERTATASEKSPTRAKEAL